MRRQVRRFKPAAALIASAVLLAAAALSVAQPRKAASPTPFGTPTGSVPNPGAGITAVTGDRASNWGGTEALGGPGA
jgi:hypothetical protein